jgi:hypothetical protein
VGNPGTVTKLSPKLSQNLSTRQAIGSPPIAGMDVHQMIVPNQLKN